MGLSAVTNVPTLVVMLTVKEAVYVRGQRIYGKSLYLPLNFAVNLKTALKELSLINKE